MIIKESLTSQHQSAPFIFQSPKSYFATKFFLLAGIVIQRIILLANNKDHSALNIIQITGLPLLFLCEGILFYFTRRNKVSNGVACLMFGLFQIIILEFFIGLTMPIVTNSDNVNQVFVLQQEILLVCVHAIMFIDLFLVRIGLLFYAFLTILFRLSPELEGKYYAGWSVMMASLIVSFFVVVLYNSHPKGDQKKKSDVFDQFENISHGLAILTPAKEVVFMNSLFKALTETDNEKHALDKVFKMEDFHSYSERDQSTIISRIHVRTRDDLAEANLENLPNAELFNRKRSSNNDFENHEEIQVQVEGQEVNDTSESVINQLLSSLVCQHSVKQGRELSPFEARRKLAKRLKSEKINNEYIQMIAYEKSERIQVVIKSSKDVRILEIILVPFWDDINPLLFVYLKDITMEMKAMSLINRNQTYKAFLKYGQPEIRIPINGIISLLKKLNTEVSSEAYSNYLMPALYSAKHLIYVLNQMTNEIETLEQNAIRPHIALHKLKKIFNEVIFMMSLHCQQKNLKLKLEWDSRIPRKYCTDADRLKQVLVNLVSNAIKFTMRGSITIRVTYISNARCKVEVIDTGVGIKHEELERLKRETRETRPNRPSRLRCSPCGIGLGLKISNQILEALGSDKTEIQINSEYGVGSTFYFILESKENNAINEENREWGISSDEEDDENQEPQVRVPK